MRQAAHDPTTAIVQGGFPQRRFGRHDILGSSDVQATNNPPSHSRHLPIEEPGWQYPVRSNNRDPRGEQINLQPNDHLFTYTGHDRQVFQHPTALSDPHDAFPSFTHRQQGFGSQQSEYYSPYATMQTPRQAPQGKTFGHSQPGQPTPNDWYQMPR